MFAIDQARGFLPQEDPLTSLPDDFAWLDDLGADLPLYIKEGIIRKILKAVPPLSTQKLDDREAARAFLIYSILMNAWVWAPHEEPATFIPKGLAIPSYELSQRFGRPPILSHASYVLENWRCKKIDGPIRLENLEPLQCFSETTGETRFILIQVEMEAAAGPGLAAILKAQETVSNDNPQRLIVSLNSIESSLRAMLAMLKRMPEGCDPDVFRRSVWPYLFGFNGITYESVNPWKNKKRSLRGETGAQSSIIPSFAAALGITHETTMPSKHLRVMRAYMPPTHRAFVRGIRNGPSIRNYVIRRNKDIPALKDAYNTCLQALCDFRTQHCELVRIYVHERTDNPSGPGGTIFMPWLALLRDETEAHFIS